MAGKTIQPQTLEESTQHASHWSSTVLIPIFIVGTLSFGYLGFTSLRTPTATPEVSNSNPLDSTDQRTEQIQGVTRPEVPTITPAESPASVPAQQEVVTGGSVTDANQQTGATNALQGANKSDQANPNSNKNQELQASRDSLKLQLRGPFFP